MRTCSPSILAVTQAVLLHAQKESDTRSAWLHESFALLVAQQA
jgi:hypothetical protein